MPGNWPVRFGAGRLEKCAIEAHLRLLRRRNPLVAKWLKQHLTFTRKGRGDTSMV
jgi:hypothetical protein